MPNYSGVWTLDEVYEAVLQNEWTGMPAYTLWVWGGDDSGRLGINEGPTDGDYSSPVQIGGLDTWKQVATFSLTSSALKQDGSLWMWGAGGQGQIGNDNNQSASSPVQVGTLTNWEQVTTLIDTVIARKVDNSLWSWGNGEDGRLGTGTVSDKSSPVQIGTDTDWADISAGQDHCLAIRSDGTLWAWGDNAQGELGDNDQGVNKSSPIQIGTDTDWAKAFGGNNRSFAIKTDGTLWAWGQQVNGELGLNDSGGTNYSSPVQVGALTNWDNISSTSTATGAIKTDGTLWTWGDNANGRLGNGISDGTQQLSSPVQIGALTNWSKIYSNAYMIALKTDGTLWGWGNNSIGRIGEGTEIDYSSPVQVGADTDWYDFDGGTSGPLAIREGRRGMS